MNSALVVAGVGTLMLFAACGSADPAGDTSVPPVAETGDVDFADGALIPSGAGSVDGVPATDDSAPDDTAGAGDATTTTAGGAAGGATTSTNAPSGGSAGATTTVPASGSSTTTTTAAPSSGELGVNEGIVRIGSVDYPFTAETCDVDNLGFAVLGFGTSSAGQPVEVDMVADTVDLDGDETEDISFDIFIVPNVDAGVDESKLPDFYASKVKTSSFSDGDDIIVTVSGTRITGSGPIEDFNGVAAADGQTLPMTFDVRCG